MVINIKLVAINGSPRKNWNTDALLKELVNGASSKDCECEMFYLYKLDFKGCKSCMACKLKNGKNVGRCSLKDDLKEVLVKIHEADILVIASPIYWHDVTGVVRCFMERLLFQYLNYSSEKPLSPQKKVAMIYTMNMPQELHESYKYNELFDKYENLMKEFFNDCTTLYATQTLQVKDYDKYNMDLMDSKTIYKRHEEVFPEVCKKAYELGVKLTEE